MTVVYEETLRVKTNSTIVSSTSQGYEYPIYEVYLEEGKSGYGVTVRLRGENASSSSVALQPPESPFDSTKQYKVTIEEV
jgi:hypothetical protein